MKPKDKAPLSWASCDCTGCMPIKLAFQVVNQQGLGRHVGGRGRKNNNRSQSKREASRRHRMLRNQEAGTDF